MFLHIFQCDATVKRGDELLHIISHYKPVTSQDIPNYIPVWVMGHKGFVETISKNTLSKKKISLEDCILTICTPGVPFYEIGLILLCRMYHLKLCVLLENHYWCTLNGYSVEANNIIIVFQGKLKFSDTITHTGSTKQKSTIYGHVNI